MLRAPFPWFGGKSKVADEVWAALGDVAHYVEPFAGSLAVLLGRPESHKNTFETVNDADEYIANFWRALAKDPDAVAHYADWPINEADLFSRHMWLVREGKRQMQAGMQADPEWYDAKIAGWWVWGISQWIGGGWCSGNGPWQIQDGVLINTSDNGVSRRRPHLSSDQGVHAQRVTGVSRKRPHLSMNRGVHADRASDIYEYIHQLAARLRYVRVTCGDWARVVTNGALAHGGTVGIFLDPPYSKEANRDMNIYSVDSGDVAHAVREWAIANGDNPRFRIVLAGYEGEHDMPPSWRVHAWKAGAAYQNSIKNGANQANRHRERLWFSPHCLHPVSLSFDFV